MLMGHFSLNHKNGLFVRRIDQGPHLPRADCIDFTASGHLLHLSTVDYTPEDKGICKLRLYPNLADEPLYVLPLTTRRYGSFPSQGIAL
jgi:hypothetical protein